MTSSPDPSRTLTPEMILEAAWRLGWLGLIYSGASACDYLVRHVLFAATASGITGPHTADLFRLAGIGMGIAMFGLSRSRVVSPQQLLEMGLYFEVAGAFTIAATEFWHGVQASAERTSGGDGLGRFVDARGGAQLVVSARRGSPRVCPGYTRRAIDRSSTCPFLPGLDARSTRMQVG